MMSKLELVTLDSFPAQVGTEFCIVSQDITFCLNNFVVINKNRLRHIDRRVDIDYSSINICDNMVIMAKPHAELRALYKETGEKFEDWEYMSALGSWTRLTRPVYFCTDTEYRYNPKPETITINGVEVPAPETKELYYGDTYYLSNITTIDRHPPKHYWECSSLDNIRLKRGLIHRSRESAEKHLNALVLASGGKVVY